MAIRGVQCAAKYFFCEFRFGWILEKTRNGPSKIRCPTSTLRGPHPSPIVYTAGAGTQQARLSSHLAAATVAASARVANSLFRRVWAFMLVELNGWSVDFKQSGLEYRLLVLKSGLKRKWRRSLLSDMAHHRDRAVLSVAAREAFGQQGRGQPEGGRVVPDVGA